MKTLGIILLICVCIGLLFLYIVTVIPFKIGKGAVKMTKKAVDKVVDVSTEVMDNQKQQKLISESNKKEESNAIAETSVKRSNTFDL